MAWWLFQNVVITATLALIVACACRTTRIGPVARHALWLVVLVKFITPPLVVWPWAAPDPLRLSGVQLQFAEARAGVDLTPVGAVAAASIPSGASNALELTPAPPPHESTSIDAAAAAGFWLLVVWIAGSTVLLAIETSRIVRLRRRVASGRPADAALAARAAAHATRLGLAAPPVIVVRGLAGPAVWGLGRPRILWPDDIAADASHICVDGLLLHELAHIRRRDHLVGWIELAAGVVWWWNPLFWYVRASLREQAELACDAWVISTLPDGRRAYAESLLTISGASRPGHWSMAVVGVRAVTRRMLERRLVMIMQGRAPVRLSRLALGTLVLAGAMTLPGWAAPQNPPAPPVPPPPPVPVEVVPTPPSPPPPPFARDRVTSRQDPQKPPPPPPAPPKPVPLQVPVLTPPMRYTVHLRPNNLPADAQDMLATYGSDLEAIQREAEQRAAARRTALIASLEALQAEHTKAGRLDEAVAIRDFLRNGMPLLDGRYALRKVR
jgi:beta-lactamase regulating signal transducer with metallopeptidase domain